MARMPAASRTCGRSRSRSRGAPAATAAALGLMGPRHRRPPSSRSALIVLETEGWAELDDASRAGLRALLEQLARAGRDAARAAATTAGSRRLEQGDRQRRARSATAITGWENRWGQRDLLDQIPDGVSARAKAVAGRGRGDDARRLPHRGCWQREDGAAPPRGDRAAGRCGDHAGLSRAGAALVRRRAGPAAGAAARPAISCSTRRARCCSRRW